MANTKSVILITGPTASGKTSLALRTAQYFNTSIISADSRQCYREMNIGVAKPSPEELASIPHYFINTHSIHDKVNAMTFAEYAKKAAAEIFRNRDVAVMAGGTGLYIKAFAEGLDDIPEIPPAIREQIVREYEEKGLPWLQQEIKQKDPLFHAHGEIKNPQRLIRALEVMTATGRSIREFHGAKGADADPGFNLYRFAIDISREQLYRNINHRVDIMIREGLAEEARTLLPWRHLSALQTVGYTEMFDYFDGKITLNEAVNKIKQNTRHYAKRQITWLRKQKDIRWIKDLDDILSDMPGVRT